jgi:hypothetical protein
MPADEAEVDVLLRRVPDVAFAPEVEGCLFPASALAGADLYSAPALVAKLADASYLARLGDALDALRQRAQREKNGGLEFLATTLRHFVDRTPADRHPLVVALWCRSLARRRGQDDVPAAIAAAMDAYESAR